MKEKTLKKQRTSTSSWWHRSCEPHPDQVCTTPKVNNRGKLFGRELSSICKDGNLPLAILVCLIWFFSGSPKSKSCFLNPYSFTSITVWSKICVSNHWLSNKKMREGYQGWSIGKVWFNPLTILENLIKRNVARTLRINVNVGYIQQKLRHKTSLRDSVTMQVLALHLCTPLFWFSRSQ